jgi:hypothetical protein
MGIETLIVLSNFLLVFVSMLLFWASMLEQHETVKAIIKSNAKITKKILNLMIGKAE